MGSGMGRYIDESDIDAIFSSANVDKWADLDADGTADAGRVDLGIAYAEGLVEDKFRQGPYVVPFSFASTGSEAVMKNIMATLAAAHLYTSRGLTDDDEAGRDKLIRLSEEAMATLDKYLAGMFRFEAALSHDGPTAPT